MATATVTTMALVRVDIANGSILTETRIHQLGLSDRFSTRPAQQHIKEDEQCRTSTSWPTPIE
ncbi:MAG: hypothetical protein ACRDSG_10440 [Pseudonocardiaceae bacterium]